MSADLVVMCEHRKYQIMNNKFSSLTMNVLVINKSVTVSYNKEFSLFFTIFPPSLLGMLLYLYTFPSLLKWVLIFLFIMCLLGLTAHLKTLLKGEDLFLWRVNQDGFYFPANRTNLFSLKSPISYSWSNVIKILYVNKYITSGTDSDKVTIKNAVLLFLAGREGPKILEFPHSKKLNYDLFKVINALAPQNTVFELLEEYNDW